jgi:predicted aspartyl protease
MALVGRIIKEIEIEGQPVVALFDTGAVFTYVREGLVTKAPRHRVTAPVRVLLGGQKILVREQCFVDGKIEGLDFFTDAVPVADLGSADGHSLDAIIGARTLEQWEIRLDPKTGALELEGLRRREFTEY